MLLQPVPPEEQKLVPKMLTTSYGAMVCRVGGVTCKKAEALVTAAIIGLDPMLRITVAEGMVQLDPPGLHTPRTTLPPALVGSNGRLASAVAGTVMVSKMFEGFTTFTAMFVSIKTTPPTTIPTYVFCVGSVLGTNPVPVSATVNVWPEGAVGMLAGLTPVRVAPGD